MVLVHELAHVRRWDNAVNLAQRIVESLLFFHPAVWIVSGWVRRDREDCCDAVVVRHTAKPQAYAELLVGAGVSSAACRLSDFGDGTTSGRVSHPPHSQTGGRTDARHAQRTHVGVAWWLPPRCSLSHCQRAKRKTHPSAANPERKPRGRARADQSERRRH